MIKVIVTYQSDKILSIEMTGHADYAEHGSDLVCAGASAALYGVANMLHIHGFLERGVIGIDEGYGYIEVKDGTDDDQLILETLIVTLETIEEMYSDYMKIVKKEA
ncbi:MAG: ribosomal-processing cysteine protease Prp [bacterium]